MVRLDPQYRIMFGSGGQIDATPNPVEMEKQIASISPSDAKGFRKFMTENREKLRSFEPILESHFSSLKDLLNPRLLKALPFLHPTKSVDDYLGRFFSDPRVRLAFCFQSKYLGMSPFRCPSLFSILSFLEDIESRHILSSDPSFYVQNAGVTDPTLAPKGSSSLYVLAPVTHQHANVDWDAEKGRFRDLILRQVRKAGYGDLTKRIRYERMITPVDWDKTYQIHMGATFNLAHSMDQMLLMRPGNRFEDLESVYLVGGGTHPGSGLPVIFESARISSRLLLQDLGLNPAKVRSSSIVAHPPFSMETAPNA